MPLDGNCYQVLEVATGSPAAASGIKVGDTIVSVDGIAVDTAAMAAKKACGLAIPGLGVCLSVLPATTFDNETSNSERASEVRIERGAMSDAWGLMLRYAMSEQAVYEVQQVRVCSFCFIARFGWVMGLPQGIPRLLCVPLTNPLPRERIADGLRCR